MRVVLDQAATRQRHLPEIQELIRQSALPAPVKERSGAVFESLAAAEAAVHGISINEVPVSYTHLKVIGGYLEGVKDGERLRRSCRAAAEAGKPVLILKACLLYTSRCV